MADQEAKKGNRIMKKWFFLWCLPLIFAICSLISFQYPGDEYALWAFSSLPGAWIWIWGLIPAGDIHNLSIPLLTVIIGGLVMMLFGLLLKNMKANIKLWLITFIVSVVGIFFFAITRYPTIEKALSKNGSWQAYIFASINAGLYLSVIPTIIINSIIKLPKKKKSDEYNENKNHMAGKAGR